MTIPYFINFKPYDPSSLSTSVDDMVSINLQQRPNSSTNILYTVGSSEDLDFRVLPNVANDQVLLVRNITLNAILEVSMSLDKNVFLLNGKSVNEKNFILSSGQTSEPISIKLNKDVLNQSIRQITSNINLSIKNISNNLTVVKNDSVSKFSPIFIDGNISIS